MKHQAIFPLVLTSLCSLFSSTTAAYNNDGDSAEDLGRWFEIEVILFKNTAYNGTTDEAFTANDLTERKRNALDLLTPYIQPDLSLIKQALPTCGATTRVTPFNRNHITLPIIAAVTNIQSPEMLTDPIETVQEPPVRMTSDEVTAKLNFNQPTLDIQFDTDINQFTANITSPSYKLIDYTQYPSNSKAPLCIIPTDVLTKNLTPAQLKNVNLDGFPVEKLPTTINGIEQWQADENDEITWASTKPYLISQDSLKLKSINYRIKRSRDYVPLLHVGWRQVGESKNDAKAVNLFAGKNLILPYEKAIAEQKSIIEKLELEAIYAQRSESIINTLLAENSQFNDDSNNPLNRNDNNLPRKAVTTEKMSADEALRQQEKAQQLATLYKEFNLLNAQVKTDEITAEENVDETTITNLIANISNDIEETQSVNEKDSSSEVKAVKAPIQPWYLDGLFKVHLDHYLYINSEFNLIEPANKQKNKTDKSLSEDRVISFEQDRRVITGEIHYFDHPYMGMVVQIRRFDPTKPAAEAVSQATK